MKFAVGILSRHYTQILKRTLVSLQKILPGNIPVFLWDNSGKDKTNRRLAKQVFGKQVRVRTGPNVGCTVSRNAIWKHFRGKCRYLLMSDHDVEFRRGALDALFEVFERHKDCGTATFPEGNLGRNPVAVDGSILECASVCMLHKMDCLEAVASWMPSKTPWHPGFFFFRFESLFQHVANSLDKLSKGKLPAYHTYLTHKAELIHHLAPHKAIDKHPLKRYIQRKSQILYSKLMQRWKLPRWRSKVGGDDRVRSIPKISIKLTGGLGNCLQKIPLIQAAEGLFDVELILKALWKDMGSLFRLLFPNIPQVTTPSSSKVVDGYFGSINVPYDGKSSWEDTFIKGEANYYLSAVHIPANAFKPKPIKLPFKRNKKYIVFAPGSLHVQNLKRYARFGAVARMLKGAEIATVGTRIDPRISHTKDLRGRFNLPELAKWLWKNARVVVGNDCGLCHLATVFDIPAIIVFGPTNIVKNTPWNHKAVTIITGEGMCKRQPCQNLTSAWEKCKSIRCLDKIPPEAIAKEIKAIT